MGGELNAEREQFTCGCSRSNVLSIYAQLRGRRRIPTKTVAILNFFALRMDN